MNLRTPRQIRPPCAETLEGRLLMSVAAPTSLNSNRSGEPDGSGMHVPAAELPARVADAISAHFPGTRLIESEIEIRRGMIVYDLGMKSDRGEVDAAITPAGEIISAKSAPSSQPGVRLLDFNTTRAEQVNSQIAVSSLPAKVVNAVDERFPGATLLQAASARVDDDTQFSVSALVAGQAINAIVTPGGRIVSTGKMLTSSELPQAVLDWVRQNFSDAGIDRAEVINKPGGSGYQVIIAPAGEQMFQATLRVESPPAARELPDNNRPSDGDRASASVPLPPTRVLSAADRRSASDRFSSNDVSAVADSQPPTLRNAATGSSAPVSEQTEATPAPGETPAAASTVETNELVDASRLLNASQSLLANSAGRLLTLAARLPWMTPKLAGELTGIGHIDLTNVGKRLAKVLEGMNFLAAGRVDLSSPLSAGGVALRLALMLAAAVCIRVAYIGRTRGRRNPAPGFASGTDFSWRWAIGEARTKRPRQ